MNIASLFESGTTSPMSSGVIGAGLVAGGPTWLKEEAEYDIKNLLGAPEHLELTNYLVVQHPADCLSTSPGRHAFELGRSAQPIHAQMDKHKDKNLLVKQNFPGNNNVKFCEYIIERSRHILRPLRRHKTDGTRRMASHPSLPIYLSGSQDGSVNIFEWNHQQAIATPRPGGTYAKVTHLEFTQQGNKFGVSDGDGNLSLWQLSTSSATKPFFSHQVHSKSCSDFSFVGCSSVLVTAGQSTDHKNVCLWDTLMPLKKAMVTSFACHEHHGASAVVFAPLNQLLITGGRKGDVFIFDIRTRLQKNKIQAHESAVKCIAIDPSEEIFATGSADGDIKVWSLTLSDNHLLYLFPGEHARSTLFRNIGVGVSNLYIDSFGRLYSCGADGSLKLRQLPDRQEEDIVLTF